MLQTIRPDEGGKEMNAPDKIYIEQKAVMYNMVNTEPCKPDDIEYIRKDALLEWIDEYKNFSSGPSWELLKTHIETL